MAGVRSITSSGAQTVAVFGVGTCKAVSGKPRSCRLRVATKSIASEHFVVDPLLQTATLRFRHRGSLSQVQWSSRGSLTPGWRIERAAKVGDDYVLVVGGLSGGVATKAVAGGTFDKIRLPARQLIGAGMGTGGGALAIVCAGLPSGCLTSDFSDERQSVRW